MNISLNWRNWAVYKKGLQESLVKISILAHPVFGSHLCTWCVLGISWADLVMRKFELYHNSKHSLCERLQAGAARHRRKRTHRVLVKFFWTSLSSRKPGSAVEIKLRSKTHAVFSQFFFLARIIFQWFLRFWTERKCIEDNYELIGGVSEILMNWLKVLWKDVTRTMVKVF